MLHQDSLKYERLIGEMPVKDKVVREQEQSGKAFRSDTCDGKNQKGGLGRKSQMEVQLWESLRQCIGEL